jgi:N-acetylglucosamine-6-phosphate deacetylase
VLTLVGGQVLVAGRFVPADVRIEGSRITSVDRGLPAEGEIVACHDRYIVPGLVDLHVNGAGGRTFAADVDEASYEMIARAHASTGTTAICPTITSAPPDRMLAAISLAADLCDRDVAGAARFVGIHVEGPFLAPAMRGGHPAEHLLAPSVELAEEIVVAGRGWVRMVTIAPELEGALPVIQLLAAAGVHVSAGHTDAGGDAMYAAMARGLTGVTHVFNEMPPMSARDPGPAGVVLGSELYAGLIGDDFHLSRDTTRAVLRTRPYGHTYLATDAARMCRSHDDDRESPGPNHLSTMVRHLIRYLETPTEAAVGMATEVPARLLRLAGQGHIRPGAVADVLVIERFKVDAIVLRGNLIERWPNFGRL